MDRIQINQDGSFGNFVDKGSGAEGQIRISESWFGKNITLINSNTRQTQAVNKQSLIDFLKKQPEGMNLEKKGFFQKGSSDDDVKAAFNNFIERVNPPTIPVAPSPKIPQNLEDTAFKSLNLEVTKTGKPAENESFQLVNRYISMLERTNEPWGTDKGGHPIYRDFVTLPLEMRSHIATLLAAVALRTKDGIEPAKGWVRDQFFQGTLTLIRPDDQRAIINEAWTLIAAQRN